MIVLCLDVRGGGIYEGGCIPIGVCTANDSRCDGKESHKSLHDCIYGDCLNIGEVCHATKTGYCKAKAPQAVSSPFQSIRQEITDIREGSPKAKGRYQTDPVNFTVLKVSNTKLTVAV